MKFLILTQYFFPEPGAAQARLAGIARELVREGHAVEVITGLPNYPEGKIFAEYRGRLFMREEWEGIPVHRTWLYAAKGAGLARMLNFGSFSAMSLLARLRIRSADWVFVECPPPTLAIPGLLLARSLRARLIVNVADLWTDALRELGFLENAVLFRWLERLESFTYRHAARVNAVSDGVRERLIERKGVPLHKIALLPNGVDLRLYRPAPADEALKSSLGLGGKRIVLYAGTHGYCHGLEHALYAARKLLDDSRIHFLFIGSGSEKPKLVNMAAELRLQNVTYLDPVPAAEVARYLSIACCGLVPLRNVPLFRATRPAKLFSIMAAGKPVVFAGEGEAARLVETAQAGVVIPPEDPEELAAAVRLLAGNEALGARMGASGRKYVEQHLTWTRIVGDWLEQLGECARPVPQA